MGIVYLILFHRFLAYAKGTVRHRIDSVNVRNAKNASMLHAQGKKINNDQELKQSDPISCPQNQKENN